MRPVAVTLFLLCSCISPQGQDNSYISGVVAAITPVKFEPGDARPMFCKIRVDSADASFQFVLESKESPTKKCETAWSTRDTVKFRIAGEYIFINRTNGTDLKTKLINAKPVTANLPKA